VGRPDGDGDFSGIDPQRLWDMINSMKNHTGSDGDGGATPQVNDWMGQANRIGLDTTRLSTINRHLVWAQDQLPMLRRRHSLAAAESSEDGDYGATGMVGAGSGDLGKYKTQEEAAKAGKDAAKKYKDGDITIQQYLALVQQNQDDPDFAAASCKELGQARLQEMEQYSSLLDEDNPEAGHYAFAEFVATSMRGGMQYKDSEGHNDITFLAPLVTYANFPANVLTDLGTQAMAPGNTMYSDEVWKALAADPKAATQFVHDNIDVLPSYMQSDSEHRGGLIDPNVQDFANVIKAGTIPGPGSDANMAADNTTKLAKYYTNHQDDHTHPEIQRIFAEDIEFYYPDLQTSLTDPAPVDLGKGHVTLTDAEWEGFIHESMQDSKATASLLSYSREQDIIFADSDPHNPQVQNGKGILDGTFNYEATKVFQEKKAANDKDAEEWQDKVSDYLGTAVDTGFDVALDPGEAAKTVTTTVAKEMLKAFTTSMVKVSPDDVGDPPSETTWRDMWQDCASQSYSENHSLGHPSQYADMYSGGKPFLNDDGKLVSNPTQGQKEAYNAWLKDPAVANALNQNFLNQNVGRHGAQAGIS